MSSFEDVARMAKGIREKSAALKEALQPPPVMPPMPVPKLLAEDAINNVKNVLVCLFLLLFTLTCLQLTFVGTGWVFSEEWQEVFTLPDRRAFTRGSTRLVCPDAHLFSVTGKGGGGMMELDPFPEPVISTMLGLSLILL